VASAVKYASRASAEQYTDIMGVSAVERLLAQLEENLEAAKLSLKRELMIRCDGEVRDVVLTR
jgi:hypothetical protein